MVSHSKNVKSHVFLKSEKNEKYVFWNTDHQRVASRHPGLCVHALRHKLAGEEPRKQRGYVNHVTLFVCVASNMEEFRYRVRMIN